MTSERSVGPSLSLDCQSAALATALVALIVGAAAVARGAPVHLVEEKPQQITAVAPNVYLVDFGRVAFGNLELLPTANSTGIVTVHFGEAFADGRIDRKPPGSVRYASAEVALDGNNPKIAAPAADERNTKQPQAVLTPPNWGVVLPFRWAEIEGWPGELKPEQVRRRAAFAIAWKDEAAAFRSSDEMLNRIWDLCHYSIKATTFAGVFVDGDRERISYEADAYLNQLSYYACNPDPQMARDTFDRLMRFPTWPSEWAPHMVFIAHADWMQTGDGAWLAARYEGLKSKMLLERAGPDGLLVSTEHQFKHDDIVDWPALERDGFVFGPVNTVVNAFHLRALALMANLARALGRDEDALEFESRERTTLAAFQQRLFDPARGLYRDGSGTDHASLHANLFPLAFGLAPKANRQTICRWLGTRGMVCSVYAAQYLLEGLFENNDAETALALMTAPGDRSWRHMIDCGATITWEAWDQSYKPNQDWNHAWGAAPANLLPRFVLGVQPTAPGWSRVEIRPNCGRLTSCEGRVPTPRGTISARWERNEHFKLTLDLPATIAACVTLPTTGSSTLVFVDGHPVRANREGNGWHLENDLTGHASVELR